MGNFFEKIFIQVVYIQNDERVMGIVLRYVFLGYPPTPSPPGGAWQLTTRPADLGSTKGGGGGPPLLQPPNGCTPLGVTHWLVATAVS